MLRKSLFLLALMLLSSHAFAQGTETGGSGYIRCPTGQQYVYLYQNLNNFEWLASPRCGDKVEILGHEDTLGGYLRVRTADGNEGYVPQAQITSTPPQNTRITIAEERPLPPPAGQGTNLPIPQPRGEALDVPRAEIFGGYSYLSMDTGGTTRTGFQGWHGSGTYNLFPWLGVELDASGHYKSACGGVSGLSCGQLAFMAGPRVAYRTGNIVAFGHGLLGVGNLRASSLGLAASETKLAWAGGGGVEFVWTERISLRVGQVDYLVTRYTQAGATQQQSLRMSAGIVFRLGRVVTE
jgi:opacity protein-like surface antigen